MSDTGWTNERIEQLKDLWGRGLSAKAIGEELGFTRNAVIGKAHRLGLANRPSPIARGASPARQPAPSPKHACSWPIGDPKERGFHFCGQKALDGRPYCAEHNEIAYAKPAKKVA